MEISTKKRAAYEGSPGKGLLSVVEIVAFGIVSLYLVVFVIPAWNGVETWCFLDGPETAAADRYVNVILVAGFGSWLAMIVATILTFRLARPTLGVLLPLGWFFALVTVATIATGVIGPQPCQGDFGIM
jgi:hypothetical protein